MDAPTEPRASLRLETAGFAPLKRTMVRAVAAPLERLLSLDKIDNLYKSLPRGGNLQEFLAASIRAVGRRYEISPQALERIPKQGPLIVVCNHPFGGLEGVILAEMLLRVRPDVKIMANMILRRIHEFADLFIFVDPFAGPGAQVRNIAPLRQSLRWLQGGGALGVFPAGEVASLKLSEGRVAEPVWNPNIARLIEKTGATVLPICFEGANGPLFQAAGLIHPRLRTALLPREIMKKRSKPVIVRIGAPLQAGRIARFGDSREVMRHLRLRTLILGAGDDRPKKNKLFPIQLPPRNETLIGAVHPDILAGEIAKLPREQFVAESGAFCAVIARAAQIPLSLREIGRLRELTFRKAGEGTGKSCDLDRFDEHYLHLFLWDKEALKIAGAYRLGPTDEILARVGAKGLYCQTLFKFAPNFFRRISPALEMGRSFVAPDYQKSYSALLLLWKGVAAYVAANPRYRNLFGPVSIPAQYKDASRQLMAGYFGAAHGLPEYAGLVKPRTPLRGDPWLRKAAASLVEDIDDMAALLEGIEADGKGVPVLLRQYLKLGGGLLGFNLDPDFSNVLDGLILVDLLKTEPRQLEKFMGKSGLAAFMAHHRGGPANMGKCA
ncbi:MAG: lysophospholipid acyltransferase family protein [Desulfovibrionaceae bacterium]|nr:lysophospholipid acyltransferase family protein [Desulfovibrionaceae bacterium]MBF0513745.1 lysophospholipid acyltransferase family protein [Desulfovibrionaceae bacterium]